MQTLFCSIVYLLRWAQYRFVSKPSLAKSKLCAVTHTMVSMLIEQSVVNIINTYILTEYWKCSQAGIVIYILTNLLNLWWMIIKVNDERAEKLGFYTANLSKTRCCCLCVTGQCKLGIIHTHLAWDSNTALAHNKAWSLSIHIEVSVDLPRLSKYSGENTMLNKRTRSTDAWVPAITMKRKADTRQP